MAFEGAGRQWGDEEDETALALLREEEKAATRIDREKERLAAHAALGARHLWRREWPKK